MATQDGLKLPPANEKSPSLLTVFRELIRANGPRKQAILAEQLGASEGHLSEVLGGSKHIPEPWLKYVSENYDPEGRLAGVVAGWKGLAVRPARRITDAAWRRASERVLAQHNGMGAALRAEIEALALSEPETDEEGAR